jgi:hypothetical protein
MHLEPWVFFIYFSLFFGLLNDCLHLDYVYETMTTTTNGCHCTRRCHRHSSGARAMVRFIYHFFFFSLLNDYLYLDYIYGTKNLSLSWSACFNPNVLSTACITYIVILPLVSVVYITYTVYISQSTSCLSHLHDTTAFYENLYIYPLVLLQPTGVYISGTNLYSYDV